MPEPTSPIPVMDWAQFGLAGVVIAALFAFLIFLFRSHQQERTEWRQDIRKMFDDSTHAVNNLEKVTNELSNAVKELIFRNMK